MTVPGFADVLDIAMERRYDMYDLRITYPKPLVPRRLCLEARERLTATGEVLVALDERPIREVADVQRVLRVLAHRETVVVASVVRGKQERAITVSVRAAPTAPIAPARPGESETVEQGIRAEIERLERRIDQLRRRLSRLREAG